MRWSSPFLQPILTQTGLLASSKSRALGLSIYGSLRVLPLRALRRTTSIAAGGGEQESAGRPKSICGWCSETAVEGIAILTPNHLITSCNPALADMFIPHRVRARQV